MAVVYGVLVVVSPAFVAIAKCMRRGAGAPGCACVSSFVSRSAGIPLQETGYGEAGKQRNILYVVPKVHKVYWVEEVEEEKKEEKPEAKSRPKLEEFIISR